ncbi:MAG: hypothetical protein ACXAEU_01225, partial [Candidatus Hodarchaeales archaeon]
MLLIFAHLFFQHDLPSSLWATYANDSWKFIANTLQPLSQPYPYHLMATSLHFLVPYSIFSLLLPPKIALFSAIIFIQFSFSLFTVWLFFQLFYEQFLLSPSKAIGLTLLYELIIFSPFLLLATSEIL